MALVICGLVALLFVFLNRVPASYPPAQHPIPAPTRGSKLGGGLDGFNSPYLGHTGSWDGMGGALADGSKIGDLDKEREMGLRWTFMPVYWRKMEPNGPVNLSQDTPAAWQELDAFIIAAHDRKLNVLMQAPVVGGNAGGPPAWAGRREAGKSAPANMTALADFAGKLAERYRPDGVLARREGWGESYGVRAWEMDNEPDSYFTHWKNQAGDYAEFVTLAAARIKAADPSAVIVAPGLAAGKDGLAWLASALNANELSGSPTYRERGKPFSIGRAVDVVSLHNFEGLDSAFSGEPRTIAQVLDDVSGVFEKWENGPPGFAYDRKQEFWHTEGNFDFIGALSADRRAAWRIQFYTRAFAAGIRKVCVMDASAKERIAVKAYVHALPWPFPMQEASSEIKILRGSVAAFRHPDGNGPEAGQVWVLWAIANTGDATVEIPARQNRIDVISMDGKSKTKTAAGGRLQLDLKGDPKMAAPLIIVDLAPRLEK
ncbi:MAG TPA: hypothetical protein VHZ30_03320 [Verrucomicrobiae bacterium]|jgi:hypothetical protein|nr:hypothetical protein [Verrucomicrobiae bacterium]